MTHGRCVLARALFGSESAARGPAHTDSHAPPRGKAPAAEHQHGHIGVRRRADWEQHRVDDGVRVAGLAGERRDLVEPGA